MARPIIRPLVFLFGSITLLTVGCATSDGRQAARTSPEKPSAASGPSRDGSVALPAGEATATRSEGEPAGSRGEADKARQIITRAEEEYELGLESLESGDVEQARRQFDRAVEVYLTSGIPLDSEPALRAAFDRLVDDIAGLEADLEERPESMPGAIESPTEDLKDITTYMSPEEAQKEMEKVGPEVREISFDIPIVINDKVLSWIDIFSNRRGFTDSFVGGYQRFGWYQPMIHRIFKEEGLPLDLIYMAFLESTYKTSAYSRARAKGIWQFMTPTGRQYGLKVDRFVDERSHPEKSTRAAARYLKDLYATLGDWHLAIAAYNTGAGNIMRAQRRSGKTNYWDLAKTRYMRTETKNFVPAILALALMSKDPAKYGYGHLVHNEPLRYDRVTVDGPTELSLVARLSGVEVSDLKFLNPHLRMGVTPPGQKNYEILVPEGTATTFMAAYAVIPDSEKFARVAKVHTVRRGETLAMIAARYGTSVRDLSRANNIRNAHLIRVGTQLTVPSYGGGSASWDDSRPARASASGSKYAPYHVVRRGDTLSRISRSYGVSLRNLIAWNGLSERTVIRPGMKLVVSRRASAERASTSGRPAGKPAGLVSVPGGGESSPDPAGEKVTYRVRRGDNLFRIAMRFRTTVDNLRVWNNLAGDSIRAGEILTIYSD